MIRVLRMIANAISETFDRRALRQEFRFTREDKNRVQSHQTAGAVVQEVKRIAGRYDGKARLKMIVSAHPIRSDGTSSRWEFFFDLPTRRAKLQCGWFLALDETGEVSGPACVEIAARQFPKQGSAARHMVEEGKLHYRNFKKLWKKELTRHPDLPDNFTDSDEAIRKMADEGLVVKGMEFTFSSAVSKDGFCWIAQTQDRSYQVPME